MTGLRRSKQPRARTAGVLAAACGLAAAVAPAAAQLTEPFPADFRLWKLWEPSGEGLGVVLIGSGWAVASAGDVNGDGASDMIIGAPHVAQLRGESYVVFGRPATGAPFPRRVWLHLLDGSDGFIAFDTGWGRAGWSVASGGDVNADGFGDVVIGAYNASPKTRDHGGRSYVVFGGEQPPALLELSDLDGERGFAIDGEERHDHAGWSVASAGDINGDGIDDLVMGAPRPYYYTCPYYCYSPPRDGRAYVIFGRDTGAGATFPASIDLRNLDGATGFRLDGGLNDQAGFAVAPLGDVNGDEFDDVMITAPYGSRQDGHAYILFGRESGRGFPPIVDLLELDGDDGFRIEGTDSIYLGTAASSGDINGDGLQDIIVSAYWAPGGGFCCAGRSFVVFGKDAAAGSRFPPVLSVAELDGTNGFRLNGATPNDLSGASVASGGDVNGDGVDDLVIGAPGVVWLPYTQAGTAYVVFGRDATGGHSFPAEIELEELDGIIGFSIRGGWYGAEGAGGAVAIVGDVNDDGVDDLLIDAADTHIVYGRHPDAPCYADCDGSGGLDFFDFLCFQNLFALRSPTADCDDSGTFDFFDFLCFQEAFATACS